MTPPSGTPKPDPSSRVAAGREYPAAAGPAGATDLSVALRPMTAADIPAGLHLCRASGWNQLARDWEHFLDVNPTGARVLDRQGHVVGTVTTLRYGPVGWLAMVLVDPAERRRGLGSRLLSAGLDLLADVESVRLDATPAGEGMYRTRGFVEQERLSRLTGIMLGDVRSGRPSVVRPMTPADLTRVANWDAEAFGLDRRALLHWLHAGAPEYAWLAQQGDRIAGYTLGRHGFDFEHLGPIVAQSVTVATDLAGACLGRHAGRPFLIDATRHQPEWVQWLEGLGFREQRPFIRMARERGEYGLPERRFASAGPEFG